MSIIHKAMNSNLGVGLWLIEWDGTVQHFEHVVECFINHRGRRRLKTLCQNQGRLPQNYYNDWQLSRNQEASAVFIGAVEDYPEYCL